MKTQRYEFFSEKSAKSWEVAVVGKSMTTTYGRYGGEGQSSVKKFGSPRAATEAAKKLIKEKVRKGYVKVSAPPKRAKKPRLRKEPSSSSARKPSRKFVAEIVRHARNKWELEEKWCSDRGLDHDSYGDFDFENDAMNVALHEPAIKEIWEKYQNQTTPDGVAWDDNAVSKELRRKLNYQFTRMLKQEPADYHPGSDKQVRDLVHPSLYPYVRGLSKTDPKKLEGLPVRLTHPETSFGDELDFWKRPYEESKFQWLPTPFDVDRKRNVSIQGYINNLDREKYAKFYECLAELFAAALPLFESVCRYVRTQHFYADTSGDTLYAAGLEDHTEDRPQIQLRGKELQVITKIVEYEIGSKKGLEGVWHVEGMSHENILATGVYVLKRDKTLAGGDIQYKRAYTLPEAMETYLDVGQYPPDAINEAVEKGVVPNGTLSTPEGRLFVFPNSHIHKLSKMTAEGSGKTAKRRVIVFWLIHPDAPIISTREVPRQQGKISKQKAKEIRLKLMNERKKHKQSMNLRSVSLCEH